jgi:hypothetical protein
MTPACAEWEATSGYWALPNTDEVENQPHRREQYSLRGILQYVRPSNRHSTGQRYSIPAYTNSALAFAAG